MPRVIYTHRRMFALPVRFGELGTLNPVEIADREYQTSVGITEELVGLIYEFTAFSPKRGLTRNSMGDS